MTKHYHVTQEQATEIAIGGAHMTITKGDAFVHINDLAAYVNAALDEVLGKPVAYEYFDEKAEYHLTNEEPPEYVTVLNLTPLYAPRREK